MLTAAKTTMAATATPFSPQGESGDEVPDVIRQSDGQHGGQARVGHQQREPAIEEGRPRPVGFSQVDVEPRRPPGNGPPAPPKHRAPPIALAPIVSQTASSQNGEPSDFAIPAGVRKIPTPITSPTTSAVAVASPSRAR